MKLLTITAMIFSLAILSCKNGISTTPDNPETPGSTVENPETGNRNTEIAPAFDGQTRVKGVKPQRIMTCL